ncbi:RING finger protein 219 [Fukomys damarensis]|uniref:RING finger protein 219 n=1 Tax=Fukomys damarensis TaxID=885580 RepID=A0A091EF93_FUKDA|nr:RING finger protein 219 [Fukomys damarensis]
MALPGRRSRPRASPVVARNLCRRDFRVGGILNAAMAQSVQNVTLSLTLPITCHICLGKVMGDCGRSYETVLGVKYLSGPGAVSALGGDGRETLRSEQKPSAFSSGVRRPHPGRTNL